MLKIIQLIGKHCSCHLQGESVIVGRFWQSCIKQAVRGELDLMVLICGAEERVAIQPLQIHPEDSNCNVCRNVG
jgi:hypothetical protein